MFINSGHLVIDSLLNEKTIHLSHNAMMAIKRSLSLFSVLSNIECNSLTLFMGEITISDIIQ